MSVGKFSYIGDEQPARPHRLDQYAAAHRELEELRDLWITLTRYAPDNRHTRAARKRVRRRADELKALIGSVETLPLPH